MRKNNKPTHEQLKELYQAASEFKQVQPWKWLYDADIICVENPRDKTDDVNVTLNKLIGMCLENGIPREIQVRSEAMAAILDDFCKKTGIKLKVVKHLSSIDRMMEEMAYRF